MCNRSDRLTRPFLAGGSCEFSAVAEIVPPDQKTSLRSALQNDICIALRFVSLTMIFA